MKTVDYLHLEGSKVNNVVNGLQQLLADYQVYYSNLRGFHWQVTGHGFFMLHSKFEEMYDDVAEKVDEIAERILMLGGVPENRYSEYLKVSEVKEISGVTCGHAAVEQVLETLSLLIGKQRAILSLASAAGDEGTVSLMSDYLKEQEKLVWMLVAYSTNTCKKD
ncbi:MAG: DNA starvation/stationary phase protection protein [Tannerellaceae bacterium]|nr:DNA starvation/stationary phase protection protein [Tannerellaceae bacterium]